jgi:hypothetical protein
MNSLTEPKYTSRPMGRYDGLALILVGPQAVNQ